MVTLTTTSRISKSGVVGLSTDGEGSSKTMKPHFISTSLSRGDFSWSFVMRIALLSASSSSVCSSDSNLGSCNERSKNSFISRSFLRKPSSSRRKSCRKPVLLEKVPFGKSAKYITVYVGPSADQSVKYVISRRLLAHPLFQVLLKCSEDEFGEEYAVNNGVAVVCDPALFVELVRAIDNNHWSA